MTVVDSHLHVWDLTASDYAWLGPQHGDLHRSFSPEEARDELAAAGVDAAVLVQAENSLRETGYLLDVADRFDFVAGVVGWVALDDPPAAAAALDRFGRSPTLRGVRHLVHDDPRDDFLTMTEVRRSLSLLAERGLPFEVPDAWPRHLAGAAMLAADLPELTLVLDHLGKPPRGTRDIDAWAAALRELARRPNTVAKLSGLQVDGQPLTTDALRPVWETALEAFGPDRLMFGGDWPMTVPSGGYSPTWKVLSALVGELSVSERERVLGGTAREVYRLDVAR